MVSSIFKESWGGHNDNQRLGQVGELGDGSEIYEVAEFSRQPEVL